MPSQLKQWYPFVLALVGAAVSLAVFQKLPDRMIVHWDMSGNPNGSMPRWLGASFGPLLIVAFWALLRAAPALDPRRENYEKFAAAYDITVAALLAMLFASHLMALALALGYPLPVSRIIPVMVGALFVVIGNVVPLARSNFLFGVRTPWTLSNERVWARTHRLAGYAMTAAGFVIIAAALLLPAAPSATVIIGTATAALIGPAVYSYFTWKREVEK